MDGSETLIPALLKVIILLLGAVFALIAWIGNRIFNRMDGMQQLMRNSEESIYQLIRDHEKRISRIEGSGHNSSHNRQ